MDKKDKIHEELLGAWEETYKKGQLTLNIFIDPYSKDRIVLGGFNVF